MSDTPASVALQHTLYESRNPTRRYLHRARRDWVIAQIARCAEVNRAMEVGSGSGVYLPTLAAVAQQVLALDVDATLLCAARSRIAADTLPANLLFLRGDLRSLPVASASIDLLLCSEVIEHIADSACVLEELAGALAPRGALILTTPQAFSPLEVLGRIAFLPGMLQLLRLVYREPVEPTGHINLHSRRRLEGLIDSVGLRIEARETLGCYLPLIAEFGGIRGQRLLAALERILRRSPLRGLLWTQCYVLRKHGDAIDKA